MPKFRQRWTEPLARTPHPNATTTLPCQACGGNSLESFYELSNVPAHSCLLLPTRAEALAFPRGDIELVFCHDCGFIGNARFDIGLYAAVRSNRDPRISEAQLTLHLAVDI